MSTPKPNRKLQKLSRKRPPQDQGAAPVLTHAETGMPLRLLDPSAVVFIMDHTGHIDIVAIEHIANKFRKSGRDAKYYPKGLDVAPKDSGNYLRVDELEEFIEMLSDQVREDAETSLTEDERRPQTATEPVDPRTLEARQE